jgi:hypothetical protein
MGMRCGGRWVGRCNDSKRHRGLGRQGAAVDLCRVLHNGGSVSEEELIQLDCF